MTAPIYGGRTILSRNADRTLTTADTVTARVDDTNGTNKFRDVSPRFRCLGASLLTVTAGHNNASGTLSGRFVFYDKDDNLVGISDTFDLPATALTASLLNASGSPNVRNLSVMQVEAPISAHSARFYATAMATSTAIDIFIDSYDELVN